MTEKELKKLGINRELFDNWLTIMSCLFNFCQEKFPDITSQGVNVIHVGHMTIHAEFINRRHVLVIVSIPGENIELLRIMYRDHLFTVFNSIKSVLFFEIAELKKQPEWYEYGNNQAQL